MEMNQIFAGAYNETPEVDYFSTSTKTGWAASPTGKIYVKKIGKTVFVKFNITGTSDNTHTRFTLSYTISATPSYTFFTFYAVDNGDPGIISYGTISSNTVILYSAPSELETWTATGAKSVTGQFFYETT